MKTAESRQNGDGGTAGEMVVWATAALLVAAAHLALAKAVAMASHPAPVEAAEPALMIDLQPLPIATAEAVQSEAVAEVEPQETAEPVFEEEIAEEPLSREKAEAAAEPAEPDVQPEIIEEPEEKELELPEAVAVLPAERPAPTKPPPVDQPRLSKKPPVKPQAAKPRPQKPPSQASQQSRVSRAPTVSLERWQARVLAWINRYKRYPPGARARGEEGMVRVAFMIDGAGRVQSVRVIRSSGNAELDAAASEMVRRASPVPQPPPEIAQRGTRLSLPVQFNLR